MRAKMNASRCCCGAKPTGCPGDNATEFDDDCSGTAALPFWRDARDTSNIGFGLTGGRLRSVAGIYPFQSHAFRLIDLPLFRYGIGFELFADFHWTTSPDHMYLGSGISGALSVNEFTFAIIKTLYGVSCQTNGVNGLQQTYLGTPQVSGTRFGIKCSFRQIVASDPVYYQWCMNFFVAGVAVAAHYWDSPIAPPYCGLTLGLGGSGYFRFPPTIEFDNITGSVNVPVSTTC